MSCSFSHSCQASWRQGLQTHWLSHSEKWPTYRGGLINLWDFAFEASVCGQIICWLNGNRTGECALVNVLRLKLYEMSRWSLLAWISGVNQWSQRGRFVGKLFYLPSLCFVMRKAKSLLTAERQQLRPNESKVFGCCWHNEDEVQPLIIVTIWRYRSQMSSYFIFTIYSEKCLITTMSSSLLYVNLSQGAGCSVYLLVQVCHSSYLLSSPLLTLRTCLADTINTSCKPTGRESLGSCWRVSPCQPCLSGGCHGNLWRKCCVGVPLLV